MFCWSLFFLCCFWSLLLVFLAGFFPCSLQCWRFLFFLLFLTCQCHLKDLRPYSSPLVFFSSGPFVWILPSSTLRMVSSMLQRVPPRCLFLIPAAELCFEKFSRSSEELFSNLSFYRRLFDSVYFRYFHILVGILFRFFLFWYFYSFRHTSGSVSLRTYKALYVIKHKQTNKQTNEQTNSSIIRRLLLLIINVVHFSMPNSIPITWLYIAIVFIRVSISVLFFANSLIKHIKWLIFSGDFVNLHPSVHFLIMWLSGFIAIINSNGESASPWKIPSGLSPLLKFYLLLSIPLFNCYYYYYYYYLNLWKFHKLH